MTKRLFFLLKQECKFRMNQKNEVLVPQPFSFPDRCHISTLHFFKRQLYMMRTKKKQRKIYFLKKVKGTMKKKTKFENIQICKLHPRSESAQHQKK